MKEVSSKSDKLTGIRVCLIDNDKETLSLVNTVLSRQSYSCLSISNTIGSSSKINQFQPHVLIIDPKTLAIDGKTLIDIYKQTLHQMPVVIIFSAIDLHELEQIARNTHIDDFVHKDDGVLRLLGRINLYVQQIKMSKELSC